MQNISILGATGSIGTQTLEVIKLHSDKFKVFALTAHKNIDLLFQQCRLFKPRFAVVNSTIYQQILQQKILATNLSTEVLLADEGMKLICAHPDVDIVMSAIVGAAGMVPTYYAVRAKKKLLLANKESLLLAGKLITQTAKQTGARIIPVDSEHNAIFQCLPDYYQQQRKSTIKKLILTASGGPFWNYSFAQMRKITKQAALKHPNWQMGAKITIDSATMMNKAFEIIEAYWLFNTAANEIEVLVHPESILHSMVSFTDGSIIAQLANHDMRVPIANALFWPERDESGAKTLNLSQIKTLNFYQPDLKRFPSLKLAYDILAHEPQKAAIINAANEIAVAAFLNDKIKFLQIFDVCVQTLSADSSHAANTLEELLAQDAHARRIATSYVEKCIA